MNIYKRKRISYGLSRAFIVKKMKELNPIVCENLTEEKYKDIEDGKREMGEEMFDTFLKVFNQRKGDLRMEEKMEFLELEKWCEENIKNKANFNQLLEGFNVSRVKLGDILNFDATILSKYTKGKQKLSYDVMKKIYNYFNDKTNKVIDGDQVLTTDFQKFFKNADKTKVDMYEDVKQMGFDLAYPTFVKITNGANVKDEKNTKILNEYIKNNCKNTLNTVSDLKLSTSNVQKEKNTPTIPDEEKRNLELCQNSFEKIKQQQFFGKEKIELTGQELKDIINSYNILIKLYYDEIKK